jgi:hypothetical protein
MTFISNEHRFAHLNDANNHEVKGFTAAPIGYAMIKNIRGNSEWQRSKRLENVINKIDGYAAPTTEVDGDVYIIESPSLDVNAITWQSGTTVRYTFTSGYDSSLYATGNYLQVSGDANEVHNGVFLITTVNASYLQVTNALVTDNTDDVASASLASAYVTHEDFDPENLANGNSIPRVGIVKYFSSVDLWYGNALETGDEFYMTSIGGKISWNGTYFISDEITKIVSLTQNNIINMYNTPVTVLSALPTGFVYEIKSAVLIHTFGVAAYAEGGNVYLQYNGGAICTEVVSALNSFASAATSINTMPAKNTSVIVTSAAVEVTNATGVFTAGSATGTGKVIINYKIHKI